MTMIDLDVQIKKSGHSPWASLIYYIHISDVTFTCHIHDCNIVQVKLYNGKKGNLLLKRLDFLELSSYLHVKWLCRTRCIICFSFCHTAVADGRASFDFIIRLDLSFQAVALLFLFP